MNIDEKNVNNAGEVSAEKTMSYLEFVKSLDSGNFVNSIWPHILSHIERISQHEDLYKYRVYQTCIGYGTSTIINLNLLYHIYLFYQSLLDPNNVPDLVEPVIVVIGDEKNYKLTVESLLKMLTSTHLNFSLNVYDFDGNFKPRIHYNGECDFATDIQIINVQKKEQIIGKSPIYAITTCFSEETDDRRAFASIIKPLRLRMDSRFSNANYTGFSFCVSPLDVEDPLDALIIEQEKYPEIFHVFRSGPRWEVFSGNEEYQARPDSDSEDLYLDLETLTIHYVSEPNVHNTETNLLIPGVLSDAITGCSFNMKRQLVSNTASFIREMLGYPTGYIPKKNIELSETQKAIATIKQLIAKRKVDIVLYNDVVCLQDNETKEKTSIANLIQTYEFQRETLSFE